MSLIPTERECKRCDTWTAVYEMMPGDKSTYCGTCLVDMYVDEHATVVRQAARIKALTDAGNAVVTARDDMDDYASGGYFDSNTAINAWRTTVLEADNV